MQLSSCLLSRVVVAAMASYVVASFSGRAVITWGAVAVAVLAVVVWPHLRAHRSSEAQDATITNSSDA